MRGASALGDLLEEARGEELRTYVVWLPVVNGDDGPPSAAVSARIGRTHVRQLWDPDLRIGVAAARSLPDDARPPCSQPTGRPERPAISWDCAMVFEPGVRWEAELPPPAWHGGAVVRVIDGLRNALGPAAR